MLAVITYSDNPLWMRKTGVGVKRSKILLFFSSLASCEDDGGDDGGADDDINGEDYDNNWFVTRMNLRKATQSKKKMKNYPWFQEKQNLTVFFPPGFLLWRALCTIPVNLKDKVYHHEHVDDNMIMMTMTMIMLMLLKTMTIIMMNMVKKMMMMVNWALCNLHW